MNVEVGSPIVIQQYEDLLHLFSSLDDFIKAIRSVFDCFGEFHKIVVIGDNVDGFEEDFCRLFSGVADITEPQRDKVEEGVERLLRHTHDGFPHDRVIKLDHS